MSSRMRDDELERTLTEVGERLDYPRSTSLATSVRQRIARPRSRWAGVFGWRLLPAALTLALILVLTAFALPDVRGAAVQFLHLRGVDIFPIPSAPAAATGAPLPVTGERVTLDDRVRAAIPPSREAGVAALVGEYRGTLEDVLLGKAAGPGTKIEPVSINGGRGFWLEGEPHLFFYRDASGDVRQDTLRLAGNTLLWEQDGVTMRLEAQVAKELALRIAASVR